ncbi:MAG: polyprenol phosphomannose-dependent alpha 1,6 mannosyltransferase MptB [Solirubrobacterales bacterium]|nr:polyprenol phosphomannose-dependent alpha 1,6 mannosyltransferase MptB [Solirubrobacterales bacterium]
MTASAQREHVGPPVGVAPQRPRYGSVASGAWTLLGLAGSVLLTLAGSRLGGGSVTWWFDPRLASDRSGQRLIFYVGVGLLIAAWLGLGTMARSSRLSAGRVSLIAGVWCLPLALGVPLFSRDIYSYLAQGTIAHLGLSPYHAAPAVLAHLGQAHVLSAVDPFWRHATAPYGPLFLGVISLIVAGTGSHLVAGALLIRAFDLLGLVLLAVFVPRLARRGGADPARAVWLAVASPLVLLQLVAPAHNDLLMAGLMVAGVSLALDRRPLLGIGLCALAATVKLPAIVAVAFVALVWIREAPGWKRRGVRVAEAAGVTLVTLGLVTLITGFGLGWVSSGLFSTPARVKLAITPATDISWTLARLLGDVGAGVSFHSLHSALRAAMFGLSALVSLGLLLRARRATLVPYLGLSLIAFAIAGPALWPWYLSWGLVLLAAWKPAQHSWLVVLASVVGAVLVQPGGILALPLDSSPVAACVWLGLGIFLLYRWRRRQRLGSASGRPEGLGPPRSVLAQR